MQTGIKAAQGFRPPGWGQHPERPPAFPGVHGGSLRETVPAVHHPEAAMIAKKLLLDSTERI